MNFFQTFHVFFPILLFWPKFTILINIANYEQAIFRLKFLASHSLITSSQIRHFHQICHFCRNRQRSTCLVGHLIWILANLKWIVAKFAIFTKFVIFLKISNCQHATFSTFWIFGQTLDDFLVHVIFGKIYPYHLNLPFSCNGYLYKMPLFVSFEFCQTFDVFFPKFIDFEKMAFS